MAVQGDDKFMSAAQAAAQAPAAADPKSAPASEPGWERSVLEKLAMETGGKYYNVNKLSKLPEEISYSEAGITMRETKDLWNMPAIFLALFLLKAGEWLLRRKWGVV